MPRERSRKAPLLKLRKETSVFQARQGDVFIMEVEELPKKLSKIPKENNRVILAHGEATGHAHAVKGDVELLARDKKETTDRFLKVNGKEATVVHEEHAPVTLKKGLFRIRRQREYTPPERKIGSRSRSHLVYD